MKKLRKIYKELLETVLQYLWREWTSVGVAGSVNSNNAARSIVDPEPLLLFSLSVCRYDQRLFDEIIDWLSINGEFINIQRLINFQEKYNFNSGPQISAVAVLLSQKKEYRLKWKKLSSLYKKNGEEKLFFTLTGKEIPVKDPDPVFIEKGLVRSTVRLRGYSGEFPLTGIPSQLLRMRALFGLNARAELVTLLGSMTEIYPAEAARYTGYEKRSVQSVLIELSKSGIIESYSTGKEKYYRLKPGVMDVVLSPPYKWDNMAPVFKGLEILLNGIRNSLNTEDMLILSSELRSFSKEASKYFNESSTGLFLSDSSRYPGEKYADVFLNDIERIISFIKKI